VAIVACDSALRSSQVIHDLSLIFFKFSSNCTCLVLRILSINAQQNTTTILVIGDLHIPHRIHNLPLKFKKLLVPGKIQQILCTGNICDKETYDYLRTISPNVHVVKGNYDESAFPLLVMVVHNPIKIGVIHGHQCIPTGDLDSLSSLARQMHVDIDFRSHTYVSSS